MVTSTTLKKDYEEDIRTEEKNLNWCSISLSEIINRGVRLEATIFDVEGRRAIDTVMSCRFPVMTIGGRTGIATAYTCPRFKRNWVSYSEFPIYQPSSILEVYPKPDGYIAGNTNTDIDKLRVHKNQVLVTCSGTVGKTSLVSSTLDNKIFSHDLLRIDCRNQDDAGYLYAYLKSETGNKILTTNRYGAVISHIEADHLADVVIPYPDAGIRNKISQLILRSFDLRDEANSLFDMATQMMIEELNLPPIEYFKKKTTESDLNAFSVRLSALAGRLDGSYHVPFVDSLIHHLQENSEELTTIGDKRISEKVILPGRFKRTYVDKGYGRVFIGGKEISELDPYNKKYLSISCHAERISSQLELHENMTLITCSGTIGNVALVGRQWENWTANQHIVRVVPSSTDIAGYLNVFLFSEYGHALISRFTYGSVVDEINDEHVRQINVPLLKNHDVQLKINKLALQAKDKRYEAYRLEKQALNIINNEVIFSG